MSEALQQKLLSLDGKGFKEFEFIPRDKGYVGEVYVLALQVGATKVPFYVGRSKRLFGRMDDYHWAEFSAATDFKVGTAIQFFLSQTGGSIVVKHLQVADPVSEEAKLLHEFGKGALLNSLPGYDYRTATLDVVTKAVHARCLEILVQAEIQLDGLSSSDLENVLPIETDAH